jgi:type IV pilus assembly protein PilA
LIAIAIPTFLGARNRAQDRAAQSSLRNALTAAKTIYTDGEDYTKVFSGGAPTPLTGVEPSLTFVTTASTGQTEVFVDATNTTADYIDMATYSKSGTCMWISDETTGANAGTKFAKVAGACTTTPPTTWGGW